MKEHKIAAVSYLNTVPFIYGIGQRPELHASLLLSPPNQCVTAYVEHLADIALCPVAAIPELEEARLATSYCLGAVGDVRTVVLMSDSPLDAIHTIYRDHHSVTSARLVEVLCRDMWGISPRFEQLVDYGAIDRRTEGEAFLLIGDKVFGYEGTMANSWDLAGAWRQLTGLPFVFATWIARNNVSDSAINALDEALAYGVTHIPQAVQALGHGEKPYAVDYLTRNMNFLFDQSKRHALELFWQKCRTL